MQIRYVRYAELSRFLVAGFANTLLTTVVYQLVVTVLTPTVAYSLAWLAGLLVVATAYPTFVFRAKGGTARGLVIATAYAMVFVIGLFLFTVLDSLAVHKRLGIFGVLAVTTTMSYFGSRLAIACTGSRLKVIRALRQRESET